LKEAEYVRPLKPIKRKAAGYSNCNAVNVSSCYDIVLSIAGFDEICVVEEVEYGKRGDPCGIPVAVSYSPDLWPSIMMRVCLFLRKLAIHATLRSGGFKLICYTAVRPGITLFS